MVPKEDKKEIAVRGAFEVLAEEFQTCTAELFGSQDDRIPKASQWRGDIIRKKPLAIPIALSGDLKFRMDCGFSPDLRYFFAISIGGLQVLNTRTSEVVLSLDHPEDFANDFCFLFSADCKRFYLILQLCIKSFEIPSFKEIGNADFAEDQKVKSLIGSRICYLGESDIESAGASRLTECLMFCDELAVFYALLEGPNKLVSKIVRLPFTEPVTKITTNHGGISILDSQTFFLTANLKNLGMFAKSFDHQLHVLRLKSFQACVASGNAEVGDFQQVPCPDPIYTTSMLDGDSFHTYKDLILLSKKTGKIWRYLGTRNYLMEQMSFKEELSLPKEFYQRVKGEKSIARIESLMDSKYLVIYVNDTKNSSTELKIYGRLHENTEYKQYFSIKRQRKAIIKLSADLSHVAVFDELSFEHISVKLPIDSLRPDFVSHCSRRSGSWPATMHYRNETGVTLVGSQWSLANSQFTEVAADVSMGQRWLSHSSSHVYYVENGGLLCLDCQTGTRSLILDGKGEEFLVDRKALLVCRVSDEKSTFFKLSGQNPIDPSKIELELPFRISLFKARKDFIVSLQKEAPEGYHICKSSLHISCRSGDATYSLQSVPLGNHQSPFKWLKMSPNCTYVGLTCNLMMVVVHLQSAEKLIVRSIESSKGTGIPQYLEFSNCERYLAVRNFEALQLVDIKKNTTLWTLEINRFESQEIDDLMHCEPFLFCRTRNWLLINENTLATILVFDLDTRRVIGKIPWESRKVYIGMREDEGAKAVVLTYREILGTSKVAISGTRTISLESSSDCLRLSNMVEILNHHFDCLVHNKQSKFMSGNLVAVIESHGWMTLVLNPSISLLVILLENPELLAVYVSQLLSVESMLLLHRVLSVLVTTSKAQSLKFILSQIEVFYQENMRKILLDEEETQNLILEKAEYFTKNDISRQLLRQILLAPTAIRLVNQFGEDTRFFMLENFTALRKDNASYFEAVTTQREKEKHNNIQNFTCYHSLVALDLNNGSNFSRSLFEVLQEVNDGDLRDCYYPLVRHKWKQIRLFAYFYATILLSTTILAYIYMGSRWDLDSLGVLIIIFNFSFIFYEIKCAISQGKEYFQDIFNCFDLLVHGFSIGTTIAMLRLKGSDPYLELNWCRLITIMFLGFRTITWMRINSRTRHLISILLEVFFDMLPFLTILIAFIFMFGFAWKLAPGLSFYQKEELSFYESIQVPVYMVFGNWPNTEADGTIFNTVKFLIMVIGNMIITLTLANFLIALLSGTFERISEQAEVHNVREMLNLISEFDIFLHRPWSKNKFEGKYFLTLLPETDTSSDIMAPIVSSIQRLEENLGSRLDKLTDMITQFSSAK